MKILIVHQHFKTPEEGGAIRSFYLAEGLLKKGYQVTVLTAHNSKQKLSRNMNGIAVTYLPVNYDNNYGFTRRILAFLKFVFLAINQSGILRKHDLCYAISTPLTVGLIGLYFKKFHLKPFIFEVGDLWPDAPIEMSVIKNAILRWILFRVEKRIYINAAKIIALSPAISNRICEKAPVKEKVRIIPNMSDLDFFKNEDKKPGLIERYQVKGKFVITYLGAVGKANNLDYLIKLSRYCLNKYPALKFLIMGKGAGLGNIKEQSRELHNVSIIEFGSKEKVREVLNVTDAVYISYLKIPVLNTGSPNKFFDGLASGKIIILNFKGWIKDLIEEEECGFYYDPDNPEEFVSNISLYLNDCSLRNEAKRKSRQLAQERFSKEMLINRLDDTIKNLIE